MEFSIVKLFPDNLVKALCDTLIHSLWQGLLLAVITGLIIVLTRKSAAAKRYNLLVAALALFATGTILTFVITINHASASSPSPVVYNQGTLLNVQPVLNQVTPAAIQKTTFTDNAISYFNKNAATVVLIWFMIVCARCLQLATGIQGIYYLRRKNIFRVDAVWESRVQELAQNLGIRRIVSIVESGVAKVPMVVGHLKPLILIPVGLLTAVPAEEIEAILVHELAHIRRSDYLVNLLQSLMEIVFFFNPAVLWISVLIKTERENCCDDIAVAQSSSKVNYIKALVSCQEYDNSSPAYAMALKGNKNHLKDRVTRIISNSNHSLNRVEKSLLAICLVTAGLLTAAFTNAEKINKLVVNTAKAVTHAANTIKKEITPKSELIKKDKAQDLKKADTLNKGKLKIFNTAEIGDNTCFQIPNYTYTTKIFKEKGILYQLNYKHKVLASMQVNGKTISPDQIAAYQPVIDRIPHNSNTENASISNNANDHANNADIQNDSNKEDQNSLSSLDSIKVKLKANHMRLGGSLQTLNVQQQKLNEMKDLAISDSVNSLYKKAPGYDGKPGKPGTVYSPKSPYDYSAKSYASGALKQQTDYKLFVPSQNEEAQRKMLNDMISKGKLKDDERKDKMISDLLHDGIISTKDNLSFKISNSEFIINGKKQPDDVCQKYSQKYVKQYNKGQGEWSWLYNYDTSAKRESNTVVDKKN